MNCKTLKKLIRYACGDIAAECIFACHYIPGVNYKKLEEAVIRTADLQTKTLKLVSVDFDKTPKDFANGSEYKKARKEYFRKAYGSLMADFNKQVEEIVKEMNEALPKCTVAEEGKES